MILQQLFPIIIAQKIENQHYGIELCKLYGLMLLSMHNNFVRVT